MSLNCNWLHLLKSKNLANQPQKTPCASEFNCISSNQPSSFLMHRNTHTFTATCPRKKKVTCCLQQDLDPAILKKKALKRHAVCPLNWLLIHGLLTPCLLASITKLREMIYLSS